jgi:penicillin-binding protein 1A
MVGGSDFKETKFNRAVQASRQVGSTFKPIVYAAAIESKKFTAGSIVPDAPFIMPTTDDQLYKPWNFGNDYKGDISLRKALALSRNVVTMRVMQQISPAPVVTLGKRLGITSPLEESLATGLGAASLTIPEITRAYSAFATNGRLVDWHIVDKVTDRYGKVLEQHAPPTEWPQVLDASAAGVVGWMLGEVATAGTAARSSELGLRVGGKTGTTNNSHDVWFVGFTRDLITTTWVGYDQPKSLGDRATGGDVALPVWMTYTKVAVPKEQDKPFLPIPGVRWVTVDETTGLPSAEGRSIPFLEGTAPEGQALLPGQVSAEDLKSVEF